MKDELRKLAHFALWIAAGVVLFSLVSCHTVAGAGQDLKEAAPWLPAPYGTIADIVGTTLVLFAGHRTVSHVRRRAAAKAAAPGTPTVRA